MAMQHFNVDRPTSATNRGTTKMSNRLPYDLRLQIGKAIDRLVCEDSTPEQVDKFIETFGEFGLSIVRSPAHQQRKQKMNSDQIKHMVNRFLAWKLPETFNPDAGISYKRHESWPSSLPGPTGTNLLDAVQAEAMVRHMLEGIPEAPADALPTEGQPTISAERHAQFMGGVGDEVWD